MASYSSPVSIPLVAGTHSVSVLASVPVGTDTYIFVQWEEGSTSLTRIIDLQADATLTATYQLVAPPTYDLTISAGIGGTTAPTPGLYPNQTPNSSVQVMALADVNYHFLRWLKNSVFYSFDNPVNVLIDADVFLHAEFEYIPPPPIDQSIIMGVVSDSATGLPVEGASVTADGYGMTTGSNGKYSLTVALGTYVVTIAKQGYQTQVKSVDATVPVTIVLDIPLIPEGTPPPPPIDLAQIGMVATPLIAGILLSFGKQK